MSGASQRRRAEKEKLLAEGWVEINSTRTVETLRTCGFPLCFMKSHSYDPQAFTRLWVIRLYVASLTGRGRSFMTVEAALRRDLTPEVCEAAEALGGVNALVELAQGFEA